MANNTTSLGGPQRNSQIYEPREGKGVPPAEFVYSCEAVPYGIHVHEELGRRRL